MSRRASVFISLGTFSITYSKLFMFLCFNHINIVQYYNTVFRRINMVIHRVKQDRMAPYVQIAILGSN